MPDEPQASRGGPPGDSRWGPPRARTWSIALGSLLAACSGSSVLGADPEASGTTGTSTGETLPPLDSGPPVETTATTTGTDTDGLAPLGLCEPGCALVLPVDWVYQGVPAPPSAGDSADEEPPIFPPPEPPEEYGLPNTHRIPAMVLDDQGVITVAEMFGTTGSIHRLRPDGTLIYNDPLPVPCDRCDLGAMTLHPSGDLMLSATGQEIDGELALFAIRHDPRAREPVWITARPVLNVFDLAARSGGITCVSDDLVVQLYSALGFEFKWIENIQLLVYDDEGNELDQQQLQFNPITQATPFSLLVRGTVDGAVAMALYDNFGTPRGRVSRLRPPIWSPSTVLLPFVVDDMEVDTRDHAFELGHTHDGDTLYLILNDRASDHDPTPRWVASAALPSTTDSRAALAVGPDGEPYAAVRTTQTPAPGGEPLVTLSMLRWNTAGELRWRTAVLAPIASQGAPVHLVVDADEGLVTATIQDNRLRVERRSQRCACE